MITKLLGFVFLLVVSAGIAFGVGSLLFYQDGYDPPARTDIGLPPAVAYSAPGGGFWEPSAIQPTGGRLLVDAMHRNSFQVNEIGAFRSKIADRGYAMEFLGDFRSVDEEDRLEELEAKLRRADSFMVILPRVDYSEAEIALVERFVSKGGKLLLISDPGRPHNSNTLAKGFGVDFQPDLLYNQAENDRNYQHIFVRDFQPEEITSGVNSVALYGAGSIRSVGSGLAFTDHNTKSSLLEGGDSFQTMAWGNSRNVLSIADFTFMVPPYDSSLDNDRLLTNIAEYLTSSSREFELADFPHFFRAGSGHGVDILLGRPELLGNATMLKQSLTDFGVPSDVRDTEDVSRDTVFLGLHDDATQVARYLQGAGVRVDDTLGGPFGSDLSLEETAVTVLDRNRNRSVLIMLADTPETMAAAVERLLDGEFRNDLVSDFAGVTISP